MTEKELKPCPFCGRTPGSVNLYAEDGYIVHPTNRCILSELRCSLEEWNTRKHTELVFGKPAQEENVHKA